MKREKRNLPDDLDQTWELLGHASQQKASSQFTEKVIRKIRLEQEKQGCKSLNILQFKPIAMGVAAAIAFLLVPISLHLNSDTKAPSTISQIPPELKPAIQVSTPLPEKNHSVDGKTNPGILSNLSDFMDDDDFVADFLVTITETPELVSEEVIDALMDF